MTPLINKHASLFLFSIFFSMSAMSADFNADHYLFGDLNGLRSQLHEQGIDFSLNYTNESGYNLAGGSRHTSAFADETSIRTAVDLNKFWGLDGAHFYFAVNMRGGSRDNLNSQAELGQLKQSLEIYGRGRVTRISELRYQQLFWDGAWEFNIGRMGVSSQFGGRECEFMSLSFCGAQFNKQSATGYNWPVSQWAASLRVQLSDDWAVKAGVFQRNPGFLKRSQGLNFLSPHGTIGMMWPVELQWTPIFAGLPGTWKLGYWYDTAGAADLVTDAQGNNSFISGEEVRYHGSMNGSYLIIDQRLTQLADDPARGWAAYLYADLNDPDTTEVSRQLSLGVSYLGPFASRPHDKWSVALAYLHVSDHLSDAERAYNGLLATDATGKAILTDEETLATYYKFQLTPALAVQPELQYTHNPGATSRNDDTLVIALKIDAVF